MDFDECGNWTCPEYNNDEREPCAFCGDDTVTPQQTQRHMVMPAELHESAAAA